MVRLAITPATIICVVVAKVLAVLGENVCFAPRYDDETIKKIKSQGFVVGSWDATKVEKGRKIVHRPWESTDDDHCKNFKIQFAPPGTFEPLALVGFMGSGTKWISFLLQQASGYFITHVRPVQKPRPRVYGLHVPPWEGSTLLYKTHDEGHNLIPADARKRILNNNGEILSLYSLTNQLSSNARGILVIRNPWRAIFSFYQHTRTGNFVKPKMLKANQINEADLVSFMEKSGEVWLRILRKWITNARSISNDIMFIFYEEMTADPFLQIRKLFDSPLLQASGLIQINEQRLECIAKYPFTESQRKPLSLPVKEKLNKILMKYEKRLMHPLQVGMDEINSLLITKGSDIQLNYTRPMF